jgi:4-amino-4-deoxy-L-arabinose transferase-like glycosyltransferase
MGHTAYQTINSLLMHLFVFDEKWLPHPVINLPVNIVFIFSLLVNISIILYVISGKTQSPEQMLLSFSAAIAAGVVTAPVAEEYHYLLFIPLFIGLGDYFYNKYLDKKRIGLQEILFFTAVLIMILPLNYKALQDSVFPIYLLAYPKLYAGLILLYVFKRSQKKYAVKGKQLSET